jgi:hypothetical protein
VPQHAGGLSTCAAITAGQMRQYLYFCPRKCVSIGTFVLVNASHLPPPRRLTAKRRLPEHQIDILHCLPVLFVALQQRYATQNCSRPKARQPSSSFPSTTTPPKPTLAASCPTCLLCCCRKLTLYCDNIVIYYYHYYYYHHHHHHYTFLALALTASAPQVSVFVLLY